MQKWWERHRGVPWPSCPGGVAQDTRGPESLLGFPPLHHTSGLPWKRAPDILRLFLPSSSDGERGPHPTSQPHLVGPTGDISSDRHTAQPAQPTPPGLGTSLLVSLRTCWAVLYETHQKQRSRGRGWTALYSHPPLDSTWDSQVRDLRALCASLESPHHHRGRTQPYAGLAGDGSLEGKGLRNMGKRSKVGYLLVQGT